MSFSSLSGAYKAVNTTLLFQVMRWLDKYCHERMERTPAKTRKNKRELDGTPDTPQTPYTPSSDSDIMSPPPVKRRSRRGLGPLMEQQQNKPDNRQIPAHHQPHQIHRRDENACLFPAGYGADENENKFNESHRPQRLQPASPMLSRVLRNTENLQNPIKNQSYHGFDIDGIKPLLEEEDRVLMPNVVTPTLPSTQDVPHLTVQDPEVVLALPFPRHMNLNATHLSVPPDQVFEDNQVSDVAWHCPKVSIKVEDPLNIEGQLAPVEFSDKIESCQFEYLPSVVLSLPEQAHPPSIEEDAQKQMPADDSSPQSDKSSHEESEEWKMRQPKKRWLREVRLEQGELEVPSAPLVEPEVQARPSVVVKASNQPFNPIVTQPKTGETKEKWMGAMALIQLAEVPDEGSQPLNLSTARYTML